MSNTGAVSKTVAPTRRHPFDGVRALLIAVVVAGHLELTDFFVGGQARVLGFFAISGFLVTTLLLKEHTKTSTLDVSGFYAKRAARLFPPLLVACGLTFVASAAATNGWWASSGVEPAFALATIGAALSQTLVFFAANGQTLAYELVPTWSLNIDQYFYLVAAPLIVVLLKFGSRRALGAVFYGAAALSFGWSAYLTAVGTSQARLDYGVDTRGGAIVLGAAVAITAAQPLARAWLVKYAVPLGVLSVTALFLLGTRTFLDTTAHMTSWAQPLFAASILLGLAVLWHSPKLGGWLFASAALVWIGLRSYGIFLFHVPIMMIMGGVSDNLWRNSAVIATTLLVAAISYRWLEIPVASAVKAWVGRRASSRRPAQLPAETGSVVLARVVDVTDRQPAPVVHTAVART